MSDKLITTGLVNNAYGSSRLLQGGPGAPMRAVEEPTGPSFADMVTEAARDSVQTIKQAEQVAEAGLNDTASVQQVVEATMEMETTLRIAVSVRDKLVEAYQQIMQMPI